MGLAQAGLACRLDLKFCFGQSPSTCDKTALHLCSSDTGLPLLAKNRVCNTGIFGGSCSSKYGLRSGRLDFLPNILDLFIDFKLNSLQCGLTPAPI